MTLFDVRKDSSINNTCFNKYLETFDLQGTFNANVKDPNFVRIADYMEVTDNFIQLFNKHKSRIEKYQTDYYQNKTVAEIAKKIDVSTTNLAPYLNKVLYRFKILSIEKPNEKFIKITKLEGKHNYMQTENEGLITRDTIIIQISSFQILKEMFGHKMNFLIDRY